MRAPLSSRRGGVEFLFECLAPPLDLSSWVRAELWARCRVRAWRERRLDGDQSAAPGSRHGGDLDPISFFLSQVLDTDENSAEYSNISTGIAFLTRERSDVELEESRRGSGARWRRRGFSSRLNVSFTEVCGLCLVHLLEVRRTGPWETESSPPALACLRSSSAIHAPRERNAPVGQLGCSARRACSGHT